jgi:hypothetical protein
MKTNGIGGTTTNRPKWAIYKKICDVLVNLGVQPSNIVLFDACDNASSYYNPFISLTDSTKIRAAQTSVRAAGMGGFAAVTLTNATGISIAADLANGNIDILVNVAACKMHNGTGGKYSYGSCTLCMKNHLGTFTDGAQAQHSDNLHNLQALFEINKHSAILGGTFVRQQLCIVDALLSNGASGPGGGWDNRTDRLVMGTFAPIVDYLSATNILLNSTLMASSPIPQAGITAAGPILPQFLTSFGYAVADMLPWTECTPPNWPAITGGSGGSSGSGGAGSGGTSATGGAGSGGTSGAGGARNGGTNAAGGTASGGTSSAGGTTSGGTSGSGGAAGGGTRAAGGARSGGTSAAGGAGNGGTSAAGGVGSGGAAATGGTPGSGGTTTSGGAGGTGGAATASASGGSATTGGTSAGTRTGASATGGSSGTATATSANSGGGCDVVGGDRRVTRWGAMLAFGAVVAERLRRLVSSGDRS